MKNPLNKRIPREFRHDFGKYVVIFAFLLLLIGLISGFLVADNTFEHIYKEGFHTQKIEDGHLAFSAKPSQDFLETLEKEADISLHELFYFEEPVTDTDKLVRVYSTDRDVNLISMMSGELPEKDDEIALDRMFARNNDLKVGDTISLKNQTLKISGLIASPDYSCLFEKNSDMMFDSINFSIAVMAPEGWEKFGSNHISYNYAWLYPEFIERTDVKTAKEKSEALIETLKSVLVKNNSEALREGVSEGVASLLGSLGLGKSEADQPVVEDKPVMLEIRDYLPRFLNQAINFTGDDMGGDRASVLLMDYIITLILAFVFAVTISGTIASEAGVIGTLRASGFSRKELLKHYMVLPMLVSLVAAVIGNILGYTVFSNVFKAVYYNSYSFPPYHPLWNADAFLLTTVIPLVLMAVINFLVLSWKLRLSPLRFLRHDLSHRGKKKAFRLNTKIPFLHRFRTRILFQNLPNYLTLFLGILMGGVLVVFGNMFGPMLDQYKELIVADRICDYQYVLMEEQEVENPQAEKYSVTSLKTTNERYKEDEISVFGIADNSQYVDADLQPGEVAVANTIAQKFDLGEGDLLKLRDPYDASETYEFLIGSVYTYNSGLAIFLPEKDFWEMFGQPEGSYNGYFSNEELTELDEANVAAAIAVSDLTKVSDQLTVSMGEMMGIFSVAGIFLFMLLMYLMTKQILEKNASSISMTKILGFSNPEIGKLYIVATSVVVVLSLLISIPLIDGMLRVVFKTYIYTEMSGYIPYIPSTEAYLKMFVTGVICYVVISVLQMAKIRRIPKSDALKNME